MNPYLDIIALIDAPLAIRSVIEPRIPTSLPSGCLVAESLGIGKPARR
jgi:hypothetical protein